MISHEKKKKRGEGIVNKVINNLPFEAHLPGYQFCGPGTQLTKRLNRGDRGINPLDAACRLHDIEYSKDKTLGETRKIADQKLAEKAEERIHSKDASFGEKASALIVSNAMKLKKKFGMGVSKKQRNKRKKTSKKKKVKKQTKMKFVKILSAAKQCMKKHENPKKMIESALDGAKAAVNASGGKS